jgi:hypothetical protein
MGTTDYQIRVRGHLDDRWFESLTLSLTPDGQTLITAKALEDQAGRKLILIFAPAG